MASVSCDRKTAEKSTSERRVPKSGNRGVDA